MNRNFKAIACCIDENYCQHCAVMLVSLFENNSCEKFRVFFLCDRVSKTVQAKLESTLKSYGHACQFIETSISVFDDFPIGGSISLVSYSKLMLGRLIPEDIEKVLYLDSDIIVRKNINNLWNIDVTEYLVASIENISLHSNIPVKTKLGIPHASKYFNAGVMLINLRAWRERNIFEKSVQYISENSEKITWWDQDVLNVVSYGQWYSLEFTWNAQQHLFNGDENERLGISEHEYDELVRDPSIVHFTGSRNNKPWEYHCQHPFKKDYWTYIKKTEWKGSKPAGRPKMSMRLKGSIKNFIRKGLKFFKRNHFK